jgi:hypothetical protein
MKYVRMDLHDQNSALPSPTCSPNKFFGRREWLRAGRSKASSASGLSPINLAISHMGGFIFLRSHYCDTVYWGRGDFC